MDRSARGGGVWSRRRLAALVALAGLALVLDDGARRFARVLAPPELVVDPNTAPAEVLLALPGLGPALVDRIVAERSAWPFRSLDDLDRRVTGLGPATMRALTPHLRIAGGPGAGVP